MARIWVPQLVASLWLLWALNPSNPYGYYVLLRCVCCGIFACLALKAHERERLGEDLPHIECNVRYGSQPMKRGFVMRSLLAVSVGAGAAFVGQRLQESRAHTRADEVNKRQRVTYLVAEHHALTNWRSGFDEDGVKLKDGHRPVYTSDIAGAVLRTPRQPVLVIGQVFDVARDQEVVTIGVKAAGYPDMNFILQCTTAHADLVLKQPVDGGEFFAIIAEVTSVSRPGFEADAFADETEDGVHANVVVEPGDQYIMKGRCLDLMCWGEYDEDDPFLSAMP